VSGDRAATAGRARTPPAEPTADDLERLAAELVRRLGARRVQFLAALLDEAAAEAAEAG
jgi:hypothetical protein